MNTNIKELLKLAEKQPYKFADSLRWILLHLMRENFHNYIDRDKTGKQQNKAS
jgi:hypothetical protein